MYPVGGGRESIWQPGMPVYVGDRVVLNTMVSTGGANLKEVRVRLDNQPVKTVTQAPWTVELDTSNWKPGYHFVEVFGQSADSRVPSGSATLVLYAQEMPQPVAMTPPASTTTTTSSTTDTITEPATAVAGSRETPESALQPPKHPGKEVPVNAGGVPMYTVALNATIHSRDAKADAAISAGQTVRVTDPTLFSVTAGPRASRFIYSLTRQGKEVFRSEPMPISSLVRLQPKSESTGVGLIPGELTMWVWAGDNQDMLGAPTMIRVEIAPRS